MQKGQIDIFRCCCSSTVCRCVMFKRRS